ncbi:hypothetical protein [Pseudomonas sp. KBW05]|uniref:hypothetical protein n=1 Tax=Pseudomonas sp. KBW05 TaxID=2153360 RepID=UPI000F59F59F|nr:hypothetical protein [Pseudomonas sp. KBW05]RQO59624.1 hypothetical protein DBR46_05535 [Pseudomonas sp. KBW05]
MRMIRMLLLWAFVPGTTGAAEQNLTTISNKAYVERMAVASALAWPRLAAMERLKRQTGFYAEAQILAYDGTAAWLIDANGYKAIAVEPVQALGLSSDYENFQQLSWGGRPTVYMGLGQELPEQEVQRLFSDPAAVPELFALATHEAFHFFAQNSWQLPSGSRSTRYPEQALPRQYRQHLISALYASLQGDADALGKARYWHDRWQAEFPQEAQDIHFYDIVEGTAEYIEGLARQLASGAPDSSETWAQSVRARFPEAAVLSLDGESYALGALAIYLLEGKDASGWQAIIEGQAPAQRLLASVARRVDVPDARLNHRIAEDVKERNRHLAPAIDPVVSQLQDAATLRLLLPMAAVAGSIGLSGIYQVEHVPEEFFVGLLARFSLPGGHATFEGATVALAVSKSCGEEGGFVVVPFAVGAFPDGQARRLQLKRQGMEIDVPFPEKGDGNAWCVRA